MTAACLSNRSPCSCLLQALILTSVHEICSHTKKSPRLYLETTIDTICPSSFRSSQQESLAWTSCYMHWRGYFGYSNLLNLQYQTRALVKSELLGRHHVILLICLQCHQGFGVFIIASHEDRNDWFWDHFFFFFFLKRMLSHITVQKRQ